MHGKIIKCASSRVAHIHAKLELSMLEGIYSIHFGIIQVDIIFYRNEYDAGASAARSIRASSCGPARMMEKTLKGDVRVTVVTILRSAVK
jgi:hypothetical protein